MSGPVYDDDNLPPEVIIQQLDAEDAEGEGTIETEDARGRTH